MVEPPGSPEPPAIVNTGGLKVGVSALGVSVVVISPSSAAGADAAIWNEMVPPGATVVLEAETVTVGLVTVPVPVPVPVPVSVGVGLAEAVDGDGEGRCRWPLLCPEDQTGELAVEPASGPDDEFPLGRDDASPSPLDPDDAGPLGPDDAPGLDGVAGADDVAGLDAGVLDASVGAGVAGLDAAVLDAPVDDDDDDGDDDDDDDDDDDATNGDGGGVAETDGATARTMAVTPLKLTTRPAARMSVTGRERVNRINIPSIDAVPAEIVLYGVFVAFGPADCRPAEKNI